MTTRTFDWVPNLDLHSQEWSVVRLLGPPPAGPVLWDCPITLDQGPEGECVGHGWGHALAAAPNPYSIGSTTLQNPTAERLYERAQFFDGSTPDEQSGASVGGGAKAAAELGAISAYHWANTLSAVQQAVLQLGPVVLGINWYAGMMNIDTNGVIHATGALEGAHCILNRGYDPVSGLHRLHQSWGTGWGLNGDCLIHDDDLGLLLSQQGEAAIPTKVVTPAPPAPVPPNRDGALIAEGDPWAAKRHTGANHAMQVAYLTWRAQR